MTELPNTESLKQKFSEDIIRNKNSIAILMVKCDNLNLINLTLGYEYGDLVLKELGARIKTIQNKNIQLFKFTAEKFVLYIDHYEDKDELLSIIEKINGLLKIPFIVNNMRQHVVIKIGVMEYKDTTKSLDKLLKDATIALNYVDISEGNNYSLFNETMELNIQRAEIIERELRAAIIENDTSKIYLVYQPIIDSNTNKIDGFEALARMNSEQFGFVSPMEFIDIAEKKQLIIPLSNLILKKAALFIANVIEIGFSNIRISVNISTIHLLQEDFVSTILNIAEETGIDGKNLELEITETIFMDNFHIVNKKLKELRAQGIHISLDDFGTGYSSFNRLTELNVDTLKIDQYFINKITDTNKDSMITRDIISIAHRLGLKTIAEGVELDIQKEYLLEYDCDKLQGYLFSKPVLEEEAIKILNKLND